MPIVEKDFDIWNGLKKSLDTRIIERDFFFHEREVWWCSLGINVGVEANGKNENFERPVLIVKKFNAEMLWVLPLTSTIKKSSFYYKFEFQPNEYYSVIISQIRTISSKRLLRKIITMNDADFKEIKTILNGFMKNETPTRGGGISEAEATNEISIKDGKRKSNEK